ncbi:MAG: XdhC family protein [Woeseiaceae bacterium]
MNEWIDDLSVEIAEGNACVLVTVAGVRGSAPREVGAKMLVTERETIGTIGGGQLEYKCTQIACNALRDRQDGSSARKFPLGANLGQCCGGVVEVLFESYCAERPAWLDELREAYQRRQPVIMVTVGDRKYLITSEGECLFSEESDIDADLLQEAVQILTQNEAAKRDNDVLFEPIVGSSLHVAVFGAGHVGTATFAGSTADETFFPRPRPATFSLSRPTGRSWKWPRCRPVAVIWS